MKAGMNCSKNGNASHNDRHFDLDKAPHLDQTRTYKNEYYYYGGTDNPVPKFMLGEEGFKEHELNWYKQTFKKSLDRKNQHYVSKGNHKQIKSISDLYNGQKTRPEEVILQYGNMDEHPDPNILKKAFNEFMKEFNLWNNQHGNHVRILDAAEHFDEKTPHIHLRRVFVYNDIDGNLDIGVKRALIQSGVELPYPDQPEGRFNNHKMRFDEMIRDLWIAIGRKLGLELDNAPKIGNQGKDLSIKEFKIKKLDETIIDRKNTVENIDKHIDNLEHYQTDLENIITDIEHGAVNLAIDVIDRFHEIEQPELSR